jgi:hypothetical protein
LFETRFGEDFNDNLQIEVGCTPEGSGHARHAHRFRRPYLQER